MIPGALTMSDAYCIQINEVGGPEVLTKVAMEPRQPGPGEALVRQVRRERPSRFVTDHEITQSG